MWEMLRNTDVIFIDIVTEYRECFNLFDKDGDNTISTAELLTVMKSLGHNPSTEEVTAMIEEVDTNGWYVPHFRCRGDVTSTCGC